MDDPILRSESNNSEPTEEEAEEPIAQPAATWLMGRSIFTVSASLLVALAVYTAYAYGSSRSTSDNNLPLFDESRPNHDQDHAPATPPETGFPEDCSSIDKLSVKKETTINDALISVVSTSVTSINAVKAHYFDWSPDCTHIAFSEGSHVFVMNMDGTGIRRLSNDTVYGWDPVYSPDGTHIAFTSRTDIYVINVDGTNLRQLTTSNSDDDSSGYWYRSVDPVWSPDGTRIAFTSNRDGDDEIYTMNIDGTEIQQLTNNTEGSHPQQKTDWSPDGVHVAHLDWDPVWSPDGTRIAFASNRDGDDEIYTINIDGTEIQQLTDNAVYLDWDPVWSPDGTRIAFASNRDGDHEIYTMNANGNDVRQLTKNSTGDWEPMWSPDGAYIVFQSLQNGNRKYSMVGINDPVVGEQSEDIIYESEDSSCVSLNRAFTRDSEPETSLVQSTMRFVYEYGWSPDCMKIVFTGNNEIGDGIFVMNTDGSGLQKLTNNNYWHSHLVWSPDSTRIAFESNRDGSYEIFIINIDGTNAVQLTNLHHRQRNPAWSSDGDRLSFQRAAGRSEIWTISADGTDLQKITDNTSYDGNATWSPSGDRIAFVSNRDGDNEIYTMDMYGAGVRQVTDNSFDDWHPVWSPSGDRIAFVSNRDGDNEIYTMDMYGAGVRQVTDNSFDDWHPVWSPNGTHISVKTDQNDVHEYYVVDLDDTEALTE